MVEFISQFLFKDNLIWQVSSMKVGYIRESQTGLPMLSGIRIRPDQRDAPRFTLSYYFTRVAPIRHEENEFLYRVQQTPYFSLHVMRDLAERLRRTTSSL